MTTTSRQAQPTFATGTIGPFLLMVAFTALWLGLNAVVPELQATGIPSVLIRLVIHSAMLVGLWLALARTEFDASTRVSVWLAIAVPFTVWLALWWGFGAGVAFRRGRGASPVCLACSPPLWTGLT